MKKLLTALTALFLFSSNASALDLKGTYDDILKNTTNPKVVQGQERGYITLGSVYYRVPHSTLNLITFQPPKIRAGCSGIDLTFGSLSYLNIDQIVQWLKQILQAAPGVAFEIALKKFLPGVANVLNELSTTAQLVNQMGVDSCQASKALVSHLFGFSSKMTEAEQQKSTNDNAKTGNADDFFASLNKALKSFNQSLKDWLSTSEGKAYQQEIAKIRGDLLYKQFEKKFGEDFDKSNSWAATQFRLISSLIGDVVISRKKTDEAGSDPESSQLYDVRYVYPVLNIADLLHINGPGIRYVYGIKDYKDALGEFRGVDESGKEDLYTVMKNLCSAAPSSYQSYCTSDPGFAGLVRAYMYSILHKIEIHTPLSDKEKEFVGATPLPILKWLNTLAYFPGVGETFIEGSKDYIASFYVEALIRDGLYGISGLPWRDMSEEQRDFIKVLYSMAGRRIKELQDVRDKNKFPIKTFNQFADFVSHYEKAVVTSLANKDIFTSL